jgi:HAD superfamily hydrolase (TIGR01509 family)
MTVHDLNLPWRDIDTVLLDMDGTLLDLAFDNFFWLELVPKRYAERTGIGFAEARSDITARYARCVGKLEWYCVEHWSAELGLDIVALKRRYRHRIGYLPGAASFLSAARRAGKPLAIVTNAHPDTIAVKAAETRVHERVDEIVSSHELAAPKESAEFWHAFVRHRPFDPRRTLLVEDSLAVLEAARRFGVRHTVAIRRPDSTQPAREITDFISVDGIAELAPLEARAQP